jgi:hypothetical protein
MGHLLTLDVYLGRLDAWDVYLTFSDMNRLFGTFSDGTFRAVGSLVSLTVHVVSHKGKKTKKLNNCAKIYFSEKSILPNDQGPRWSRSMEKIGGKKLCRMSTNSVIWNSA